MATPYKTVYPTLGGLMMGSKAIDCYDFTDFLGAAPKRGNDEVIDGAAGVVAQTRIGHALQGFLYIEILASYDQDNQPIASAAARETNLWTLLDAVRTVAQVNTIQTFTITGLPGGPHSADAIVVDGFEPSVVGPGIARVELDVVLPDGALL